MREKVLVTRKRYARRRKLIMDEKATPAMENKEEEMAVEENVRERQGTAEAAVVERTVGVGEGQATAVEAAVVERLVRVAEGEGTTVESTAGVEEEGVVGSEDENSEEGDESEEGVGSEDENEVENEEEEGNGRQTDNNGENEDDNEVVEEEDELQRQENGDLCLGKRRFVLR